MRLDKFLKVSRIIKRRTVAKEVCDTGKVLVNGRVAKPGTDVKVGDIIEIQYASGAIKAQVNDVSEHVTKAEAEKMYKIISGKEIE
ncbi:Ribosomal 50S subunit-recycling heat shock protein, contains S4 domain [Caloramator quimbayensis]|uniref:RQC P-site tRNA stabilizing factor n=1 Tax=Caloramator quimbayensis TaxID=1147123 RepID=A0A1T4Y1C6_9CLOT|nr:RNA-binding S4 domain-containing protein [Caloramator quimbayensis]SKA95433.1 Ribosomal 50S subunit-recycling heat shock protein, contains S4 domain [Caloramator quimbayensis]